MDMKFIKVCVSGFNLTFSKFEKNSFGGKDPSELGILKLLPSRGFFVRELPALAFLLAARSKRDK
jgi:hypothetical protein